MKKVIYTKYSVERSDNFKIVTSIVKNENGSMQVEKKAAHYKAQSHVESLAEKYKDLKEYYQDSVIEPVFCEMANGQAVFPYIEGESLESRLDKYVNEKDYKGILSEIENYKKMITDNVEIVPFHICDEFIGVFGANYPEEGIDAFKISDIDLIFSNIIISRDKWKVIDYEWTFNFAVPVEFIVYRAIKFYAEINAKRKFLTDNNIYSFLGISEKERELYNKMDDAFQSYVYGEHMPTWRLYESISGKNAYLQDIISKNIDEECMNEIQVFYDYGEGYSEENSYKIFKDFDKKIEIEINLEKGVNGIRIDPDMDYCIVKFFETSGNDGGLYDLDISSNGVDLEDNCIVFLTKDPQIYIQNLKENTKLIYIMCKIQVLQQYFAYSMGKSIKGFQDKIKRIELEGQEADRRQSGIIEQLKEEHQSFENELEQIRNEKAKLEVEFQVKQAEVVNTLAQRDIILKSTSWKITKPYRFIARCIKRIAKVIIPEKVRKSLFIISHDGFNEFNKKYVAYRNNKRAKRLYVEKLLSPDKTEFKQQRKKVFSKDILFSIIVPLYNTPKSYLIEMIESCQNQTYGNWELCLADGSDVEHRYVGKTVQLMAKKDSRIKYMVLEKNAGISENTNVAIKMASGNYIALLDHDDLLHSSALYEYMQVICEQNADFIYSDEMTFEGELNNIITMHFKPDFAIDNLRANNYICHFSVFSKELLEQAGLFRKEYDGSQDHDMILRLTEKAKKIIHVPQILYFWRSHPASVASDINSKVYAIDAGKRAVLSHLERCGLKGSVKSSKAFPTIFNIEYEIQNKPLVSILIPNKDNSDMLSRCINSILDMSTYGNYEIVLIENNSTEEETFRYYASLKDITKVRIVYYQEIGFNYSAINNLGVNEAKGDYLLFLNNDIEIITPDWIEQMLMFAQRSDVGAVGAKLYYPDNSIQHAGIIIGLGSDRCAGGAHHKASRDNLGYMGRLFYAQNFSAVTAACMMVSAEKFRKVKGFNEDFAVAYNDVDLCLKLREEGYLNIWTPLAEAYHYESVSRGYDTEPEKRERFLQEAQLFREKWHDVIEGGDPYYNPNLTLDASDFSVKG